MPDIEMLMKELTLEEKAALCTGADNWHTVAVERLGLAQAAVADGPHGLRKERVDESFTGVDRNIEAICFPSGAALASSFDRKLLHDVGHLLGEAAKSEHVDTLLGPAVNMKRSPLCGRSFEYLSEDPYLAGELAADYVRGVQEQDVGVSVKHFAANNQEFRRMSISAVIDERTLREIYLAAFETVVKKAKPWTLMCSYNRINGVYSCENEWLLKDVLREEWGFDGIVMTDWGAMNNRCAALRAGLNLEMPACRGETTKQVIEAVKNGSLEMEVLDRNVRELLGWINKCLADQSERKPYDKELHHAFARKASEECAVLLKNEGILPLAADKKIAFIGGYAESPRFQGGGSSFINCFRVTNALEAAAELAHITYAKGFGTAADMPDEKLLAEAVECGREAEIAVIFAGLPDIIESEGYDRKNLDLPECQNRLIEAVAAVQPNTVVVLHNGSPVLMPWSDRVKAILEMYLGGQAAGEATANLLFGKANPSGKLAETFPKRLEDVPSYLDFPGTEQEVQYGEGVYIGYRYYDSRNMDVLFPFGHGLSYTTFEMGQIKVSNDKINDQDTVAVTVTIKNTGSRAGQEVVQLYVEPLGERKQKRPLKELKGFEKIRLEPGESTEVEFILDKRSFSYYETRIGDWYTESGTYRLLAGNSGSNLPLYADLEVTGTIDLPFVVADNTTLGDVLNYCKDPSVYKAFLEKCNFIGTAEEETGNMGASTAAMERAMQDAIPLHSLSGFQNITKKEIQDILDRVNNKNGGK